MAWPRGGTVFDASEGEPYFLVRAQDDESGLSSLTIGRDWYTLSTPLFFTDDLPIRVDSTSLRGQPLFPTTDSSPDFQLQAMDQEGNVGYRGTRLTPCFVRWPARDSVLTDLVYVDPDGSDDLLAAPEGSFSNPYQSLTSALSAATYGQAVVVLPGVYSLSSTLTLKDGVSLLGFGSPDEIILDGGNGSFPLLTLQGYAAFTVGNLTLRNAASGAVRGSLQHTLGTNFGNLIVQNMSGDGIQSGIMWDLRLENCTFTDIAGAAIRFSCIHANEVETGRFRITDNIFNRCGTGIATQGLATVADPASGCFSYNLFNEVTTGVSYAGTPQSVASYTGDIEESPSFVDESQGDFHLKRHSPAIWSGNPLYLDDAGEAPRSLGALAYSQLLSVRNPHWLNLE
jgi:hypothetical protein